MSLRLVALSALATALMGSAAFAADLTIPSSPEPILDSEGLSWEGLYIGAIGGGYSEDGDAQGFIGGVIGGNVYVADPVFVGGELQANYYFENDDWYDAWEVLALGKLGVVVSPGFAIYAAAGVGYKSFSNGDEYSEYALGAGIEAAVTESVSIRGDILAVGFPDYDEAFSGARASVGLFYHF